MSISNNIDGSTGGSGQLLDFLSLVTNPKIYEAKIKTLQEVTATHQKFVELVAPATEIMDLREKLKADKAAIPMHPVPENISRTENLPFLFFMPQFDFFIWFS